MQESFEHNSDDRAAGRTRRVGIVSLSVIPDDPRVRRQGDLLAGAGWDVIAIGLPGHRSPAPTWRCPQLNLRINDQSPNSYSSYRQRVYELRLALHQAVAARRGSFRPWLALLRTALVLTVRDPCATLWLANIVFRRLGRGIIWNLARPFALLKAARITVKHAERLYWGFDENFRRIYCAARREQVDLWLANDWTSLPIARKLATEQSVPFAYDTHELAVDEYAERWLWRLLQRPLIAAVEGFGIRNAAFVSCVSEGIARRLASFYRLSEPPLVVRNIPVFEPIAFRPTAEKIRVLYHGIVAPGRALDCCIESVALWRPEFDLTIRGPGSAEYLAYLRQLATEQRVADRVTFCEPVPMVDLVRAAAEYDVGLFALAGHSLQNVYVLPNKFFEYIMAGLALCVSDLPEMTRVLRERDLGVLIASVKPESIAAAINPLDREMIDKYKRNSLAAAHELNWATESRQLLNACELAVSAARN